MSQKKKETKEQAEAKEPKETAAAAPEEPETAQAESAPEAETAPEPETPQEEAPPQKTELEKAQESVAVLSDRLMRTAAEFDNFKKRTAREKDEVFGMAVCATLEKLLPVLDNLERAVAAGEDSGEASGVLEGVKMVKKQFEDALTAIGVTPIQAVGQPFDPERHNAVMTQESDQPENTVLEELMKGYLYQDKVIRHSMVKVSN